MLYSSVLCVSYEYFCDKTVRINVPVHALELASYRSQSDSRCAITYEPLHAPKVQVGATHPQPRELHTIYERCLKFGQIAHEIRPVVVTLDLGHLEAVVLAGAVLLFFAVVDLDRISEVDDVVPPVGRFFFASELTLEVTGPILSIANQE